jgi:uncharacterized membrane protein YgdD (TMEM256/DUF423 family)
MNFSFSKSSASTFLRIGALLGFIDVAFGAFGAHALRERLSPDLLAVFETGVRYQMYHSLAILIVALFLGRSSANSRATWAGWCFVAGIVLFSGSLYVLALTGIGVFGAITPIGGLFFLAGWLCLLFAAAAKES